MMIVTEFERATYDPLVDIHLQYFFNVTAPALRNHRTASFWNTTVLQACQQVQCIRQLAIAVASLERYLRAHTGVNVTLRENEFQLAHYSSALKEMSTIQDVGVVLVGCMMLVLLEDLRRAPYAALVHLRAGLQLLNDKAIDYPDSYLVDELRSVFSKISWHQSELAGNYIRVDSVYRSKPETQSITSPPGVGANEPLRGFTSLNHACHALKSFRSLCITPQPSHRPLSRFNVIPGLTEELNDWFEDFNVYHSSLSQQEQEDCKNEIHALRAYHLILKIASCSTAQDQETWYDYHDQDFDGLVAKFAVMCEMGRVNLSPLLFFVACKYRDVAGRRRAIELLRYQANGWEGVLLADVAEQIVQIEEEGLDQPVASVDVPEICRVRPTAIVAASHSRSRAALCVLRAPFGPHAETIAVRLPASRDGIDAMAKNLVRRRILTGSHLFCLQTNMR